MFLRKKWISIVIAVLCAVFVCGSAWAATFVKGDFSITADNESSVTYTPAGSDYQLYGWNKGTYKRNGVLEITESGTYTITMRSGKTQTTDRIKIRNGTNVYLTIEGLNIAPNQTDGSDAHYGEGRPFDMKGATVALTLKGTNTFIAPTFSTALFCPANSRLTIDGDGTLNINSYGKDLCVAGIGGEGKTDEKFTYDAMKNVNVTSGHENLYRVREWPNDDDSRCGDITINANNGTPKINVQLKIGDWDPSASQGDEGDGGGEAEYVAFYGDAHPDIKSWCLLKSPSFSYTYMNNGEKNYDIDLGQTYYLGDNQIVGIGGAFDGNITINGGKVDVKVSVLSVGIGSVNREFGKVKITNGDVNAVTCWKSTRPISFTDYVGGTSLGPAIGWVKYGDTLPSNMVIEITGGKVNAKSSYGAAGIGGGVDSTGGTIIISGGDVTAVGGNNGAGIGSGIGQSITGNRTGEGKIIITGGTVNATGGINAAGIGGGGNPLGFDKTGGQSGTIIIAGNANVTATGGQNAPGIGAGGAESQNNYNANAAKVQAIIITTTGNVSATAGYGAPTNIGASRLGNDTSTAARYVGSVIVNTSNAQISDTANMPNLAAKDNSGNIGVTGTVDLTKYDFVKQYSSTPNVDIVSKAVVDYLKGHSQNSISGSAGSSLNISTTQSSQIDSKQVTGGVKVEGVDPVNYQISVQASTAGGSVSIDGFSTLSTTVANGTSVTISATPDSGYEFERWSDGNTNATRTVTVDRAITLTASFKLKPVIKYYTVTPTSINSAIGTVSGGGTVQENTNTTVTVTVVDSAYMFDGWYVGEDRRSSSEAYTFTVKQDVTLQARFELKPAPGKFRVRVATDTPQAGTVTGDGDHDAGDQVTVVATVTDPTYVFDGWYDGDIKVSSSASYSFTITGNTSLNAKFVKGSGGGVSGDGADISDRSLIRFNEALDSLSERDRDWFVDRIDKNGPNAVAFRNGAIAAINNNSHDDSSREALTVMQGESFEIELFWFAGDTENLNGSKSSNITMQISYGSDVVSDVSRDMDGGYARFVVSTSDLHTEAAEVSGISARNVDQFAAHVFNSLEGDESLDITVPFIVINASEGGGYGGSGGDFGSGGCAGGTAAVVALAIMYIEMRRGRH